MQLPRRPGFSFVLCAALSAVAMAGCGTLIGEPGSFSAAVDAGLGDAAGGAGGAGPDLRVIEDGFQFSDARLRPDARPRPPADAASPDGAVIPDARAFPPPDGATPPPDGRLPDSAIARDLGPPIDAARVEPDAAAPPAPDASTPDAARPQPDATPAIPDATPPEPDVAPPPPPDAAPLPDACIAGIETCNGLDEDCDGRVDEQVPDDCAPCGIAGATGLCGRGVAVCVEGQMLCAPRPLPGGPATPCNAVDDDCDGRIDEGVEVMASLDARQLGQVDHCPAPPQIDTSLGDCGDGRVGCGAAHVCVDSGCRATCDQTLSDGFVDCDVRCALGEPFPGACLHICRADAKSRHLECLLSCADEQRLQPDAATAWTCANVDGGPVCAATDCPAGFKPRGAGCVPRVEICNNGLDDEGDGLIDGVVAGDDPCVANFDQRGTPQQMGRCQTQVDGTPCEDATRMSQYGGHNDEWGSFDPTTPRMVDLTYRYALDKEEVSIRAYAECVRSGCCLEPVSPAWLKAMEVLGNGLSVERPEVPSRCAASPDLTVPGEQDTLPDLPVTGVSWCMARDYCNWAGKRLPTEYEWEHATAGPSTPQDQRRVFAWGDEPPPDCVEAQCCRSDAFGGALPGTCTDGLVDESTDLLVCPENEPPAGTRDACLGTYNKQDLLCQGEVHGPAPAYANRDGQSPEGVLNLTGNVAEWLFDWASDSLADQSSTDPVGPGCDATYFAPKRVVRGRDFTSRVTQLRSLDRFAFWESTRAPNVGFRCGRTLPEDGGLCDPQVPLANRDRCLPGADARIGERGRDDLDPCVAPNFDNQDPQDLSLCGGAPRKHSDFCDEGISDFCATDIPTGDADGCGSFIITKFALPTGLVGESDAVGLLNAVFESSLITNGGSTIIALGLPEAFNLTAANWPAAFGSADIDAQGRLVWLGTEGMAGCETLPYGEFGVRTVNQRRDLTPVCRAVVRSDLWLREAPVSLAFSALAMEATYEPVDDTMRGTMTLVMTYGDTQRLRLGSEANSGEALGVVLANIGLSARPLCGVPIAFSCLAQPLFMPGCNINFGCDDPETCMGWGLPFEFEAVRASRSGLPNLRACAQ